jgi:hypothetical protein
LDKNLIETFPEPHNQNLRIFSKLCYQSFINILEFSMAIDNPKGLSDNDGAKLSMSQFIKQKDLLVLKSFSQICVNMLGDKNC